MALSLAICHKRGTVVNAERVNHEAMMKRIAATLLAWITSPYLKFSDLEYADVLSAEQDHTYGAPALRRAGFVRTFHCPDLNREIMKDAALAHTHEIL